MNGILPPPMWNERPVRWHARDQRERRDMIEWTLAILDEYFKEYYYDDMLSEIQEECRRKGYSRLEMPYAMKMWRQGDAQPLQRLYPEIKEAIQPPKLGRGKKYPKLGQFDHVRETANIIRRFWRAYFRKYRRRPEDGASAQEIAAEYHKLNEDDVAWKPGGHRKKKTKAQNNKQQR
jgi:hypothetical protein